MKTLIGSAIAVAFIGLPMSASAAVTDKYVKTPPVQEKRVQEASDLKHTHHHCHIVVTLGHAKKRCHTHRHNKVIHHGPKYH